MRVCVCVFIKLHITAQSRPVIYSFYATACNPPGGYLSQTYFWLEMRVHTATTPLHTLHGEKCGGENAGNGGQACPPPTHE